MAHNAKQEVPRAIKDALKTIVCATLAPAGTTQERIDKGIAALFAALEDTTPTTHDRALKRREVAARLSCSLKSVTLYGQRGLIRRISAGEKGRRALGYSEKSVEQFLAAR